MWISLDGVAASGKSSVALRLADDVLETRIVPEFSGSPVGRHLQAQVRLAPHFIKHTPLSQSLLFISDYSDLASEALVAQRVGSPLVIQDRGFLSKYVYQLLVLSSSLGRAGARKLMDEIFAHLPRPDITVLLDLDLQLALDRHGSARRAPLSDYDLRFMGEAITAFREECQNSQVLGDCQVLRLHQDSETTVEGISRAIMTVLK